MTSSALPGVRRLVATIAIAVLFVGVVVAAPIWYSASVVENEARFVTLGEDVVVAPSVRDAVAETGATLVIGVIELDPALTSGLPTELRTLVAPLARIATTRVVDLAFRSLDDGPAGDALDAALREVHREVMTSGADVTIDLTAVLVRVAREIGGPAVGSAVANTLRDHPAATVTLVQQDGSGSRLVRALRSAPDVGRAAIAVLVGLAVVAVLAATDRRRAVIRIGVSLIVGTVVSIVLVMLLLHLELASTTIGSEVADIVGADFAHQQRAVQLIGAALIATGLVLGGGVVPTALRRLPSELWRREGSSTDSVIEIVGANAPAARISVWLAAVIVLAGWSAPTARVVATVMVLTALGQALVWSATSPHPLAARWRRGRGAVPPTGQRSTVRVRWNLGVLTIVVFAFWPGWSLSLLLDVFLIGALVQLLLDVPEARGVARASAGVDAASGGGVVQVLGRVAVAGVIVVVAVVVAVALFTTSTPEADAQSVGCNGTVELCDRRLDEVVFAGSHNAMAASDLGWELAPQTGDIVSQLDDGVRALLIDTHYWTRSAEIDETEDEAVRVAIERALSDDQPRAGTWLCHGFCALGATRLDHGLAAVKVWLDSHPDEVVLMIIQDEISTADTLDAFESSGLVELVHDHRPGDPFPTLGELIERDERLLVWAENEGTPDSWYQNAYDSSFQETGFAFPTLADFDCEPNRGSEDNPLFLVNHWLSTGVPTIELAGLVNTRELLVERLEECAAVRGRRPTIVATDFVQVGDVVEVVAALNAGEIDLGVDDPPMGDGGSPDDRTD